MNNVKGIGLTGAVITLGLVLALTALVTSNTFAQANSDDSDSNTPATGAPTISGTARLGETLTVDVSGIADEDGLENAIFQFVWYGDVGRFLMATAPYRLDDDPETIALYFDYEVHWLAVGTEIHVQVYFTDDAGNEERLESAPTEVVPGPLVGITLVDTSSQSDLAALALTYEGGLVTLDDPVNGSYGFRVELAADAEVGSVHLELTEDRGRKHVSQTDNGAPFSLYGDDANGLLGEGLPAGSYWIDVTAYSESDLGGDPLQALVADFTVVETTFVSYERESYSVSEGGSVPVQVNLSRQTGDTVTVPITFNGSAVEDTDYTVTLPPSKELVFNSGDTSKSFTINAISDPDTSNETIILGFGAVTGASPGSPNTATITIRDTTSPPRPTDTNTGGGGGGGGGGANRRPDVQGPVNPSYQENGTGPVATYTANDPDGDAITWDIQIVGREDGDKFIISGDGSLSFKEPPDYENPTGFRGNTYRVRIRATDDGSPSRTDALRVDVQVTPINEVGPVTGDAGPSIAEDWTGVVGQYQAEDPEGDAVTWSLSGPDASGFSIDQEGNLSLTNPLASSAAGTNVHGLTVTATDDGSPAASAQLDITVTVTGESQGLTGSGVSRADMRISARPLDDGRVEFALQRLDTRGDRGERLLPSARFLPSDAGANQWFNSSSLSLEDGDPGLTVRISGRLLEDGSVEFALQRQDSDGEWGERLLPTARFLASDAQANQWFNSSPLSLYYGKPSLTVRISAQLLADGRVEFSLQQQANGDWGQRLLPSARFLASDAQANQWFNSSSLSLDYGETDLTVRISARRLADGRVEFALQQQADGDWGERLLPSARFLPSDAAANQWLTSTAVTLTPPSASTSTEEGG